jgi:hypothetical protein
MARFNLKYELLLAGTKIFTMTVVFGLMVTTWTYCGTIFYDREEALHDALQCATDVLAASGHNYWLVNGSLLGASRLRRFVVWDAEIDIGFERRTPDEATAVATALHEKCFHYSSDVECDDLACKFTLCGRRVCLELTEFVPSTTELTRAGLDSAALCSQDGCNSYDDIFPLVACNMAHTVTQCPHRPQAMLHASYGSKWATEPLTSLF